MISSEFGKIPVHRLSLPELIGLEISGRHERGSGRDSMFGRKKWAGRDWTNRVAPSRFQILLNHDGKSPTLSLRRVGRAVA